MEILIFRAIQAKIASVIKQIEKNGKMTNSLRASLKDCHSISEVEHLVRNSYVWGIITFLVLCFASAMMTFAYVDHLDLKKLHVDLGKLDFLMIKTNKNKHGWEWQIIPLDSDKNIGPYRVLSRIQRLPAQMSLNLFFTHSVVTELKLGFLLVLGDVRC